MDNKELICVLMAVWVTACAASEKRSEEPDGWAQCKPIANAIEEISKGNEYNLAGVQKVRNRSAPVPECNDGVFGEGMSDIVAKSLAADFKKVATAAAIQKDLNEFIVKHLNSSADWSDLDKIAKQAKSACPPKAQDFCRKAGEISVKASKEAKAAANHR